MGFFQTLGRFFLLLSANMLQLKELLLTINYTSLMMKGKTTNNSDVSLS